MTFKTTMSKIGTGLMTTAAVLSNSGIQTQIDEIDTEISDLEKKLTELREDKTRLESRLIKY
jgi:peptidoglycan hydrolase CwlO-like protein